VRRQCVDHDRDLMAIDGTVPEIWDTTRLHDLACWAAYTSVSARQAGPRKGSPNTIEIAIEIEFTGTGPDPR
jgi:hypothetical protein